MRLSRLALRLDAAADETRQLGADISAAIEAEPAGVALSRAAAMPAAPGRLGRLSARLADQFDEAAQARQREAERIARESAELADAVRAAAAHYRATDDGPGEV